MKYLVAIFGVFILVILGVVLLTRGNKGKTPKVGEKSVVLSDYKNNTESVVEYSIEGPINADENHRTIRIWVTPNNKTVEVLRGYRGDILKTQTFDNNPDAYGAFLDALNRANFTAKRNTTAKPEGVCPTGNRSHFRLTDNGDDVIDSWTASCVNGTFGGSLALTTALFHSQIPDYSKTVSGVNVGASDAAGGTGLVL